jgi:hypothetical protein
MSWRAKARQRWPGAIIHDDGPWASVSLCPPVVTVHLHEEKDAALADKAFIDRAVCGSKCWGKKSHRLVNLAEDVTKRSTKVA